MVAPHTGHGDFLMNFLVNSNSDITTTSTSTVIDGFDCNFALDNVQRSLAEFLKTNPSEIMFCVGYQKVKDERAKGGYDECFPIELNLAKTSHHSAACAAVNKMMSLSAEMLKDGVALLPIAFRWDDLPAVMGE
jgi:hypothetical protein